MKSAQKLHIISTGQQSADEFLNIASIIHEDVDTFHIREKDWTASAIIDVIHGLRKQGVLADKIIVNDRIDIAYITDVAGVHLAHHSVDIGSVKRAFPLLKVGCSVHSGKEAIKAEEAGANYLIYGHIFGTQSKPGLTPRGTKALQDMLSLVNIPVIAIGGITFKNTKEVLSIGVDGIAVMSGILLADDPVKAIKDYRIEMGRGR